MCISICVYVCYVNGCINAAKKNEKIIIRFLLLIKSILLYYVTTNFKRDIIELQCFSKKVYFARGNPLIYDIP